MDKLPFINKYGRITYCIDALTFVRQRDYIIIKKGTDILCKYNPDDELFSLPSDKDVEIVAEPTLAFTVLSYVYENRHPIKETQTYRFYDVKNADLADAPLQWCAFDDIALKKIMFDATQMIGIKNLVVRINKNEENL